MRLGSLLVPLLFVLVGSGCDEDAHTCSTNMRWCDEAGECVNTSMSRENCGECGHVCPANHYCIMGECVDVCYLMGLDDCDPAIGRVNCVNLDTDRSFCGSCSVACADGEYCHNRVCTACEAPRVICRNACVDLMRDIQHCGECDHPCVDGFCHCGECYLDDADVPDDACPGADGDADVDGDGDADGDSDADADVDGDADGDADADPDLETRSDAG